MAEGWGSVKRETIVKCFKKCGIISGESAVVARIGANEDPFDGVDEAHELTALVDELGVHDSTCSPQEYVTGDDNLPVLRSARVSVFTMIVAISGKIHLIVYTTGKIF